MPTLLKRASVVGNIGTGWANTQNAVDAGTATFATWNISQLTATGSVDLSGFDFSTIPAEAVITSVSIRVKGYVNQTGRHQAPLAELFVGGVSRGGAQTLSPHVNTTTNIYTAFTRTMTAAELRAGNFFVRFTARRGDSTLAANTYLDWCEITVDYAVAAESAQVWNGTSWQVPEIWNGTRWVPGSEAEVWNGTQWIPLNG
jgi:hypothetical protein